MFELFPKLLADQKGGESVQKQASPDRGRKRVLPGLLKNCISGTFVHFFYNFKIQIPYEI